jgi:hypothetical protein
MFDASGKELSGGFKFDPYWTIFIVLDKPSAYSQATWSFSDPGVRAVIDDATQRSIIFRSTSPMTAGELIIRVIPIKKAELSPALVLPATKSASSIALSPTCMVTPCRACPEQARDCGVWLTYESLVIDGR